MLVVIRGGGDLATGIALRLYRAKMQVVICEAASPTSIRRTVCFSEAVRLGETVVEGVAARRADLEEAIRRVRAREAALQSRSAAPYHRSLRLLRAHPSASAKDFAEALEALKKLGKD